MGPHWPPVYNPCTTILSPITHGHLKPALKPTPKSTDTRWPMPCQNPRAPKTHPETHRVRVRCSFQPTGAGAGFHPLAFWGGAGFWSTHPRTYPVAIPIYHHAWYSDCLNARREKAICASCFVGHCCTYGFGCDGWLYGCVCDCCMNCVEFQNREV
jgi:hypothetical protein